MAKNEGAGADAPDTAEAVLHASLSHLLRRAHFHSENLFTRELGQFDVTARQLALLVAIRHNPGAAQRTLAEVIRLDVNTVSDLVRRLVRKGLVVRRGSDVDGRSKAIALTPTGEDVLRRITAENPRYQDALARNLSDREAAQLKRLLRKLLGL